jgi:aminoglycoside phosphotransferase (APT) family kinase protein
MLLTQTNMIHYLLDRGLMDTASFAEGRFSCRQGQSRHHHFIINKEFDSKQFFVKQAVSNEEKKASLQREGLFYELLAAHEQAQLFRQYLPQLISFDERNATLVLQYLAGFNSIYDWLQHYKDELATAGSAVADALYALHTFHDTIKDFEETIFFTEVKPWILSLPQMKMTGGGAARSEAEEQSMRLIFSVPGFIEMTKKAAQLWQPSSLIHGDAKLTNFLIKEQIVEEYHPLKIIDWELAAFGDPLWDVATVFQSILTLWVIQEDSLFQSHHQKVDTVVMQTFISNCWKKYAMLHQWSVAEANQKLEACVSFSALRLLHACFESTPGAKSLRPYSARLLQLAHNILSHPLATASQLFTINPIYES